MFSIIAGILIYKGKADEEMLLITAIFDLLGGVILGAILGDFSA